MESFLIAAIIAAILSAIISWLFKKQQDLHRQIQLAQGSLEQANQELNLLRVRLDAISEGVTEGIVIIGANERIIYLNRAAKSLLNLSDGTGREFSELTWSWHLQPLMKHVLARQAEFLSQIVVKDDRTFQVSLRAIGADLTDGAIIVLNEITELQRLGRIRRDFVANISHELRTPVTSLQLLAETLSKDLVENPALALDLLSKLRAQIDLLHHLMDELMDLALIESGQMPLKLVEVSVIQIVHDVIEQLEPQAERKGITIEIQVPPELRVLADSAGIHRALSNLLHNALKFTPSHGKIWMRARRVADNIEVQVADNGIGIPARDLPRIFERFYKADRTRAQDESRGTGLGLAIAKHIIEGHGGKLWAESTEGKGSTFYFSLPTADE